MSIATGGLAFDPVRDLLYVADQVSDNVIACDTSTWVERFRLAIGKDDAQPSFLGGVMHASDDGRWLFLSTASGVQSPQNLKHIVIGFLMLLC